MQCCRKKWILQTATTYCYMRLIYSYIRVHITNICFDVNSHTCMYVCMYVAQLVRACSWRLATSGTFGSGFKCGRATYISSLGQGTDIQLPLFGVSVLFKQQVHGD